MPDIGKFNRLPANFLPGSEEQRLIDEDTLNITGGEAMVRAIVRHGVDTVFGLPGAQIYPLFDAFTRLGVTTLTTRHEQGAAYMAFGYAKAQGKPGVCAVVPGPGLLNASAALCTAQGTCTPLLCLTGQVPSEYLGAGRGHLHELSDSLGTLRSLIKDAKHITDATTAHQQMDELFATMLSGRRGAVAAEMCWDTMAATRTVMTPTSGSDSPATQELQPALDETSLQDAANLLRQARHPMIVCGAGAQHAAESVRALAEALGAPVTAFRSGRGVVAEDHPLGLNSLAARLLFDDCDLLLGLGSRLEMPYMRWRSMNRYERRPEGGPTLIRVDIDAGEFERLVPDVAIHGDVDAVCRRLANMTGRTQTDYDPRIAAAQSRSVELMHQVQPQYNFLNVIREVLPRDGFLVPELCQAGFTSYFGFPVYEPRTYVTEGYQGTLGFGFQTALGVKVACPERAVVSITGDGGLLFGIQELATAATYNIGVVTILFNNNAYGNVRRDQQLNYGGRINGADLTNPDFVALAESFGVAGYRVNTPGELRSTLERTLAADAPALIEVASEAAAETSPWPFIHMPEPPGAFTH